MHSIRASVVILSLTALMSLAATESAAQEEIRLIAERNNTLYQTPDGTLSNGAGQHIFAGRTNQAQNNLRRALVWFDVAGEIPEDAIITDAVLELWMSQTISGAQQIGLHRVTASWGEGSSQAAGQEGMGGAAAAGDATWVHRFHPDTPWSSAGGDFEAGASATASVADIGRYTWSSAAMVDVVQLWLEDPDANHGWLLRGNEQSAATAKRFGSRHNVNADHRPVLVVSYMVPTPEPPSQPMLVSPADAETSVPAPPTLLWTESARAETYHLQVARNAAFEPLDVNEPDLSDTSYVASDLASGTTYFWRVRALNVDGESEWSAAWSFATAVDTPVEDVDPGLIARPVLHQNYPNPIMLAGEAAETRIQFRISRPDHIRLSVFDLLGRHVTTLVDGFLNPGDHRAVWRATDHTGRTIAPGIYLYRLESSTTQQTRRMVVVE